MLDEPRSFGNHTKEFFFAKLSKNAKASVVIQDYYILIMHMQSDLEIMIPTIHASRVYYLE